MHLRRLLTVTVLSIGALVATVGSASAASYRWTGEGADTRWDTVDNWFNDTTGLTATALPGSGDDVTIPGQTTALNQVLVSAIDGNVAMRSLTVQSAALEGNAQAVFTGTGTITPSVSSSITGGVFNGVNLVYPAGAGTHLIVPDDAVPIDVHETNFDSTTVTVNAGATLTTSGFTTTTFVTFTSNGTLTVSGGTATFANVYARLAGAIDLGADGTIAFGGTSGYVELRPGHQFTGTGTFSGRGVELLANTVVPTGVTVVATNSFYGNRHTLTGAGTFNLRGGSQGGFDSSVTTILSHSAALVQSIGIDVGPAILRGATLVTTIVGVTNQDIHNYGTMSLGFLTLAGGFDRVGGFSVIENMPSGTLISTAQTGMTENHLQLDQIRNTGSIVIQGALSSDQDPATTPELTQQGGSTSIEGAAVRGYDLRFFQGSITAWSIGSAKLVGTILVSTGATLTVPIVDPGVTSFVVSGNATLGSSDIDVSINSATQYSRLVSEAVATINGGVQYRMAASYAPAATDTFPVVVSSGAVQGLAASSARRHTASPARGTYFVRVGTAGPLTLVPRFATVAAIGSLHAGSSVTVTGAGFIAGETVALRIDAAAPGDVAQGSGVADASGAVSVSLTLPATTPAAGTATIHALGTTSATDTVEQRAFTPVPKDATPPVVQPPLAKPSLSATPRGTTLATVRARGLVNQVAMPAAGSARSTFTIPAAVAKRLGLIPKASKRKTPVVIGSGVVRATKAGAAKLTTPLTRTARAKLAKVNSVKITQTVVVTIGSTTTRYVRVLTLKQPKPAKR